MTSHTPTPILSRRMLLGGVASAALATILTACGGSTTNNATTVAPSATRAAGSVTVGSSGPAGTAATASQLPVVAIEDFWGSIVAQVGGARVAVTAIINSPNIDPHDYEPKATDARSMAGARYVVVNGAGYDPWAMKLLDANPMPGRKVLAVADLVGKKGGDNPHLWYNPDYVTQMAKRVTTDFKDLDPSGAPFYDDQSSRFLTVTLKPYMDLIATIKQRYQGTSVGASESIFVYLSDALGLKLLTPPSFLNAISESSDPSPHDKATIDQQIARKQIKVYVYNQQNTTPDIDAQKNRAQAAGIPVVAITETPDPASLSFQDWQVIQLQALQKALAQATGK